MIIASSDGGEDRLEITRVTEDEFLVIAFNQVGTNGKPEIASLVLSRYQVRDLTVHLVNLLARETA